MTDPVEQRHRVDADPVGHGAYPPGGTDEITEPPTDPVREAKDRDIDDPAHTNVDAEELRQGGPTWSPARDAPRETAPKEGGDGGDESGR